MAVSDVRPDGIAARHDVRRSIGETGGDHCEPAGDAGPLHHHEVGPKAPYFAKKCPAGRRLVGAVERQNRRLEVGEKLGDPALLVVAGALRREADDPPAAHAYERSRSTFELSSAARLDSDPTSKVARAASENPDLDPRLERPERHRSGLRTARGCARTPRPRCAADGMGSGRPPARLRRHGSARPAVQPVHVGAARLRAEARPGRRRAAPQPRTSSAPAGDARALPADQRPTGRSSWAPGNEPSSERSSCWPIAGSRRSSRGRPG